VTPHVAIGVETTREDVLVRVSTDGPGISDAERATLFERHERGGSHGLGLSIVRTLVERYGGSIDLTETGHVGTEFVVRPVSATGPTGRAANDADTK
jgi:signal transduction histidine kinase